MSSVDSAWQIERNRPAQSRLVDAERRNTHAADVGFYAAACGFNFRKFRHDGAPSSCA
jgi:hypothetical protein